MNEVEMSVAVDDGRVISRDLNHHEAPDMALSLMQVGGVDADILTEGKTNWFFSNTTSFKGDLQI